MQIIFMAVAGIALLFAGGTYFDRGSERRSMRRRGVSLIVAGFAILLSMVAATTIPH